MLQQYLVLALDDFKSADSAADVDPHPLGVLRGHLQTRTRQGELRRRDGELDEAPHLLDLFFLDVVGWVETLHFSRDPAGEGRWIELGDGRNPALAHADGLPGRFRAYAERRQQPDAGHYHSSRQNDSP